MDREKVGFISDNIPSTAVEAGLTWKFYITKQKEYFRNHFTDRARRTSYT